jgi:aminocarboxymuconate-semialdehyde decarboxylase
VLVIDTQHHLVPPGYHAALREAAAGDGHVAEANAFVLSLDDRHPCRRLDGRLAELDAAGVDVAVLSVPPPPAMPADRGAAAAAVTTANEELIEACATAPDRYVALAGLPLPHVDAALAELDRLAARRAVRGLSIGVDLAQAPDPVALEPVLARASELDYPVVIHPASWAAPGSPFAEHNLFSALEHPLATSLLATRLVLSGVLDRLPELVLVVPHLGGVLPYLAQRLQDSTRSGLAAHPIEHYLRTRLLYDTCSFHLPALRCAIDTVGAERIVLGSDYPFRGALRRCVDDVAAAGLDAADEAAILGRTAGGWFTP